MAAKSATKNEFLTIRDPGGVIRAQIDELRVIEGGGKSIPPDRTSIIRSLVQKELTRKKRVISEI